MALQATGRAEWQKPRRHDASHRAQWLDGRMDGDGDLDRRRSHFNCAVIETAALSGSPACS